MALLCCWTRQDCSTWATGKWLWFYYICSLTNLSDSWKAVMKHDKVWCCWTTRNQRGRISFTQEWIYRFWQKRKNSGYYTWKADMKGLGLQSLCEAVQKKRCILLIRHPRLGDHFAHSVKDLVDLKIAGYSKCKSILVRCCVWLVECSSDLYGEFCFLLKGQQQIITLVLKTGWNGPNTTYKTQCAHWNEIKQHIMKETK